MTAREPLPLEPVSNEKLRELECNALDEPALLHLFNWHDLAAVVLELAERRRRPPSAREEVIEECARVADARADYWDAERKRATGKLNKETRDCCTFKHDGARDAAFAIRALAGGKQ